MAARKLLRQLSTSIQLSFWKLKTLLLKTWIAVQEHFGWYTYRDWVREVETPGLLSAAASVRNTNIHAGVLIIVTSENQLFLPNTISSLQVLRDSTLQVCLVSEVPLPAVETGDTTMVNVVRWEAGASQSQILLAGLDYIDADWISVLACGDALSEPTLALVADTAQKQPEASIIYTDEDLLTASGERIKPFCKPDWSPELLLCRSYLLRAFVRRELFRKTLADSQTYEEAVFRSVEQALLAAHLPHILTHIHPGSAPGWFPEVPTPFQVQCHLQRQGRREPHAWLVGSGQVRVSWGFKESLVSIIIPSKDNAAYLARCLESIQGKTNCPAYEIIVVDNGSQEKYTWRLYAALKNDKRIRVLSYAGEFNYSAAQNYGARTAYGEIFVFLNNDTEIIDRDWLEELARWAAHPQVGVVGAQLIYPNGAIQHAGIVIGMEGHASHVFSGMPPVQESVFGSPGWYRNFTAVTGACKAIRRSVFEEIGGFDERYQLVFSDVEICLRAGQAGYRVIYNPFVRLVHYEGRTRRKYIPAVDIELGYQHFKKLVANGDPFYNPNLSTIIRKPTLRRPWEGSASQQLENIRKFMGHGANDDTRSLHQ